jgi:predicted enzyme related to lactoylglutathione lyase/AcrR family transcriptional regulator
MGASKTIPTKPETARGKLLQAALGTIRAKGYSATSVDELCAAAGVTKGAFFHHFPSKEALAVAAADYWSETTGALFASAPYHRHADPLDRVLGYIDFRAGLLEGPLETFTCLAGTMVQEAFSVSPAIRAACEASIFGHARTLEADIAAAMERHGVSGVTARSLALHTQAVLQGAFILAKARGGADVATDSVAQLKRYFILLFRKPEAQTTEKETTMANKPSSFIWYELITSDLEAAARFYGDVAGWSMSAVGAPGRDYRQWSIGGETIGGAMALSAEAAANGMRPVWLGYLNVDDVDDSVARIVAAGGAAHMPAWDIPGVGRIAMVGDPQGAAFYVMAPVGEGPSPSFAPGRPGHGGWHELHTTDWRSALAFYGERFGWAEANAMDMGAMGTYQLFKAGGDAIGGMMNSPAYPRPMWLYYFNVDDIHAAKSRVEASGGTILNGPHEVPGGSWVVQAQDPQGAMFALVGANRG